MQYLDLVTLRLFLATARDGSIAAAAKAEHIAPSALSRRISDLETTLGVRLLRRLPRGVELTAAGRLYAEHGRTILDQSRELLDSLRDYSEGIRGEVRLQVAGTAFLGPLPAVVRDYHAAFPDVAVSIVESYSREAIEAVRTGEADIAVVADTLDYSDLVHLRLWRDPVWVVAPKGHPLLADRPARAPVPFREATRHEFVALHEGGAIDELLHAAAEREHVSLQRAMTVNSGSSLRRLVEAGMGIGFLRESGVRPFLRTMEIEGAPLADQWAQRWLSAAHRADEALPRAPAVMLERLVAASRQLVEV